MPLLKTKICNQLKAILGDNINISLKNIVINGSKRGCSGHITHTTTGNCVYINTEPSIFKPTKVLWRYAKDENDFSSNSLGIQGINHFVDETNLISTISQALTKNNI